MKRTTEEDRREFARALGEWSRQPPNRTPGQAAERFRSQLAATDGSGTGGRAPALAARWLAWSAAGTAAAIALVVALRPAAPPASAPDPGSVAVAFGGDATAGTVVVHELSSGTRVYLMLPMPAPR